MRKAGTRQRLMDSTEKLLYTVPYERLTIAKITEDCGVSRQVFYKYFLDKEDLFTQMSRRFLYTRFSMEQPFFWRSMVLHFLEEQQKHRNFYMTAAHATDDRVAYRCFLQFVLHLYRNMIVYKKGEPASPDEDVLLQIYCRGGIDYLVQWEREGMKIPIGTMLDSFEYSMPPRIHDLLTGSSFPPKIAQK